MSCLPTTESECLTNGRIRLLGILGLHNRSSQQLKFEVLFCFSKWFIDSNTYKTIDYIMIQLCRYGERNITETIESTKISKERHLNKTVAQCREAQCTEANKLLKNLCSNVASFTVKLQQVNLHIRQTTLLFLQTPFTFPKKKSHN